MSPFVIGQEYERSRLLEFIGSRQAQSGVLWGREEPGCLICTSGGRGGKKAGYSDERLSDGTWWYFGQGRTGDQSLSNAANSKLSSGKFSVLLFTTREPTAREVADRGTYGKLFTYCGQFNVSGFDQFVPSNGNRQGDKLLRFRLLPIGDERYNYYSEQSDLDIESSSDLREMQYRLTSLVSSKSEPRMSLTEYRSRSAAVHLYASLRSNGQCEACGSLAPFSRPDGRSFLEVHHLTRLADDGPDLPSNVAALCPNCHRRVHYSVDRKEFGRKLQDAIALKESIIAGWEKLINK
ncbi:HNH endonuclease signature motif containing protein [Pseudomonas sp. LP_4_YM]|uniref:HNH endonuclease n=1 Tax=Pseudomonas sp. LP_4_YM TaxID=2485135 RepID=UPI0010530933|nr:HNH endonuclease signature motif containing protein [Pseudomonas sp. LP_4_YM]TCT82373.1 5-methylcytosine-specific restriction protein A [Pseudomonas sp. LP_4_YM]